MPHTCQCGCLLVDMYRKINKVHFFQLVPRPISTVKEGDWVFVIYEEEKSLGINTPQDFETDTVYYETVYCTSIMTKLINL